MSQQIGPESAKFRNPQVAFHRLTGEIASGNSKSSALALQLQTQVIRQVKPYGAHVRSYL
jgi:hypothetical protein